jgi:hypothetical protein
MTEKKNSCELDFQAIYDDAIAFLHKEILSEPGWKGISYLFENERYGEVLNGLICSMIYLEGIAESEFTDEYMSEYLDEGEKITNKKRVEFARHRISEAFEDYNYHAFSLHKVKIQSKKRKAILGFSVSGPGGQYGFDIECIGVFADETSLLKKFKKNFFTYDSKISDSRILRLWKK